MVLHTVTQMTRLVVRVAPPAARVKESPLPVRQVPISCVYRVAVVQHTAIQTTRAPAKHVPRAVLALELQRHVRRVVIHLVAHAPQEVLQ